MAKVNPHKFRYQYTDSEARAAISQELDTNLFVEASAGSGKTTSLVNRMVALVEAGKPVSQICTITFTVAAADEFFARFQELLSRRSIYNPNDESVDDLGIMTPTSMARCQEALKNIDLCFTGTMDSFCNMIAHELPNELGLPSNAQIISDDDKERFIKEECLAVLKDKNHPLHKEAVVLQKAFGGASTAFDAFSTAVIEVFDYRGYDVVHDTDLLSSASDHILDKQIDDYLALVKEFASENIVDYLSDSNVPKFLPVLSIANMDKKYLHDWKSHTQVLLKSVKAVKKDYGFNDQVLQTRSGQNHMVQVKKLYCFDDDVIDLAQEISTAIYEYFHQLLFSFVTKITKDISLKMKVSGNFTFFDFLYYLTLKFQESCNTKEKQLIKHIRERHKYFLIDESQDTNPMQTEMFFFLTSTAQTDDWSKAEPEEGSLFIVGDPKQSIYGFRDADVNTFNRTKGLFLAKDEMIYLTKNFRSNKVLRKWFNDNMNMVLSRGTTPLVHQSIPLIPDPNKPKELLREQMEQDPNMTFNGVYYYSSDCSNKKAKAKDATEVAKIIDLIVDNDDFKIIPKKVNDPKNPARKIQYKDILVITRTKSVSAYVEAFANLNIPLMVEAKIFFNYSKTLLSVIKLLRLMFEPYKIQNFVNVTEDLYQLSTEDIIKMRLDGFDLNITNIIKDDGTPITFSDSHHQDIVNELNELYQATRGMTVSSTLFYLLSNKSYLFLNKVDNKFLEYAYFVLELVKQKEIDGSISSFMEADAFLNDVLNNASGVERAMQFKKGVDQVKISNLHKVKGLQAPVVILAEPAEDKKVAHKYVDRVNKKIYFSSIITKGDGFTETTICASPKYQAEMDAATGEAESEIARLEYVAATRAEAVLIIAKPKTLSKTSQNPWADLCNVPNQDEIPNSNPTDKHIVEKDVDTVLQGFTSDIKDSSNDASYRIKKPSEARVRTSIGNTDVVIEKDEDFSDKAFVGTLVHRLLECIVVSHNQFDIEKLIKQLQKEYPSQTDYSDLLRKVAEIFVNGGFDQTFKDVPKDLFNVLMNAEDVMCEVPFAYETKDKNGNTIVVSGTIDLIYKDKDGWHIIDYKTGSLSDITALENEYAIQLAVYARAQKMFANGEPLVDTHIYHIDLSSIK